MKSPTYFLFAIALLVLLGTSCEKELDTTVYGYAKTYGSDSTHAGIKVELYGGVPGSVIGGGGSHRLIASAITDANGYYRIKEKLSDSEPYYIIPANWPAKHHGQSYSDQIEIKPGQNKQVDVIFNPYAWLNIHFKNVNPYDNNDQINFFTHNGAQSLNGALVDTWVLTRTSGNRIPVFSYGVVKNGQGATHKDTVGYVAAFDTVDFEVFY